MADDQSVSFNGIGKYHISYHYPYIGKTNAIPITDSLREVFRQILETFEANAFDAVYIYDEAEDGEWIEIYSASADDFLSMIND